MFDYAVDDALNQIPRFLGRLDNPRAVFVPPRLDIGNGVRDDGFDRFNGG